MPSTEFAQIGERAARAVINRLHNVNALVQPANGGAPVSVRVVAQRSTQEIGDDLGVHRLERRNTMTLFRDDLPGKCAEKGMIVSLREPILDFKAGGYEVSEVIDQTLYLSVVTIRPL